MPASAAASNQSLTLALISDTGGPAASGTTFYYNVGSKKNGFVPTNSFGPGPSTVSRLVQSWKPSELLGIGDLAYNGGGSTIQDISIGQYYNNFMYPYPSPAYLKPPYTTINGSSVVPGQKSWPYNLYDYPNGFPNPVIGGTGGSPDQRNHFWGALGNHDYGLTVGYSQVGVTPYNYPEGNKTGNPVGPSSARDVESFVDYVLPFLSNPDLLGADRSRLNIGSVDKGGNSGVYYSISFGGTAEAPLVEFFILDTARLNGNSGFEDWNPSGSKSLNSDGSRYVNAVNSDIYYSFDYDPSSPTSPAYSGTTTDPFNGYKQFTWLKRSLEASKATWKIIAGHHPVYASGRWKDEQPDDHMSIPYLQKLLNALPEGSFDAYYNGHDHYYERVIESKAGGIGLGIPFITNGNSGRNLEQKIQVPYGVSVYNPTAYSGSAINAPNPNLPGLSYLLDSGPLQVGASGLAGDGTKDAGGFSNGYYGHGFGATKMDVGDGYLLFKYEEARVLDPAIANHLPGGIAPQAGFAGTTPEDWIPNPGGVFNGLSDLARFKLEIDNGVVTEVKIIEGGSGYMSSKGGNYVVRGFNIYGNNVNVLQPWEGTAKVDLTFTGGKLTDVVLTDGGRGYELAVQAAADNNTETSTRNLKGDQQLVVAINYNLEETQYLVRDSGLYNDWYLLADTAIDSIAQQSGAFGGLQVSLAPNSKKAQELLATLPITTGYSGVGAQRAYATPQQGAIQITDRNNTLIAGGTSGPLANGVAALQLTRRPAPGAVNVAFGGDPLSSYLVNFREANKDLNLSYGEWSSGISLVAPQTIKFTQDVNLSLIRTDSVAGPISFGLKKAGTSTPSLEIEAASGASNAAINTNSIFIPTGTNSWLASEARSLGSFSSSLGRVAAGDWVPVATNGAGQELTIQDIQVSANAIDVTFSGGFRALFNSAGTGIAQSVPGTGQLAVTVQRLGRFNNGLAFYEADSITGAVVVNGRSFLPGEPGYLQAALASAQADGLILSPDRLPSYGAESVITDLPLSAQQNYGLLLLRNNSTTDLVSSYGAANPGGAMGMTSFVTPGRGVVYGIEDYTDNDFNDLIVGLSGAGFQIL